MCQYLKLKFLLLSISCILLISCQTNQDIIEIKDEVDLIPEGIAIDQKRNAVYLSSIHKKKIVKASLFGGNPSDFIASEEHGFKLGVGMTIKENTLFALSGEESDGKSNSMLSTFNLDTGSLLHKFELTDTVNHFLNDLAISDTDQLFITDTKGHRVYTLKYPDGELELFLNDEQVKYPNGIAISSDNTKLFVDSWFEGLRIVDISTRKILNAKHKDTSEIGIDGLKYFEGRLYTIRNGGDDHSKHGLIKISLSEDENKILAVEDVIINDPMMNVPTTFDIVNGTIYLIANSQMDNLDQSLNEVIDRSVLTNTYILTHKITDIVKE